MCLCVVRVWEGGCKYVYMYGVVDITAGGYISILVISPGTILGNYTTNLELAQLAESVEICFRILQTRRWHLRPVAVTATQAYDMLD